MNKLLYGRRVLVVEDEMLVLMMMEGMLADLGCESIVSATTVDQALALIDGKALDAALLDMNLNASKTHRVADALAAADVPFAFVTGYGGNDIRECDRDRPLLKKPFEFERLAAMLTGLLG
jgi:CheY-like chemotaxis protein